MFFFHSVCVPTTKDVFVVPQVCSSTTTIFYYTKTAKGMESILMNPKAESSLSVQPCEPTKWKAKHRTKIKKINIQEEQ